jgi:hypothetical protein
VQCGGNFEPSWSNTELRKKLKKGGFLTRDSRIKERKKWLKGSQALPVLKALMMQGSL